MPASFDRKDTLRYLHSLRVATGTALARHDLSRDASVSGQTHFLALAAKGLQDFQFPEGGLVSFDGLLRAKLSVEADGGATLTIQALGGAGLRAHAQRRTCLSIGDGLTLESTFDQNGTLTIGLTPEEVGEADLSRFSVATIGQAP